MYRGKKNQLSNRSRILECIYRNAPIARSEIAELTEITSATVTNTVSSLILEGCVQELDETVSEKGVSGRRKVPIDIVPSYGYCIGVEFTTEAMALCITDLRGTIISQQLQPFSIQLAENITENIIRSINSLMEAAPIGWEQIIGIGIAVLGQLHTNAGYYLSSPNVWLTFQPDLLRSSFPVPVVFENNVKCMALAAYLFRIQNSPESFSFFHVGKGMYCASLIEGELFSGRQYIAGEVGHTVVDGGGRLCDCGKRGCLQMYSSETALLQNAQILYESGAHTLLRDLVPCKDDITIETIVTAYSMNDPAIVSLVNSALRYLSISISNIAIIMDPEKIYLHGQLFNYEDIRTEFLNCIHFPLPFSGDPFASCIEITPRQISDGARGACALAIERFFIRADSQESLQRQPLISE